jgi:hypothetical protein
MFHKPCLLTARNEERKVRQGGSKGRREKKGREGKQFYLCKITDLKLINEKKDVLDRKSHYK